MKNPQNHEKLEIISIEPSDLAQYWVVTYKIGNSPIEKEIIKASDPNEAFVLFRNQMIQQHKASLKNKH